MLPTSRADDDQERRRQDGDAVRRRRILFRATHRGTYENDLIVGGFVRARLAGFSAAELDAVEAVMEHPDAVLADWLTGRQPIPAEADCAMLRAMREAALSGEARAGEARVGDARVGEARA